MLFFCFNDLTGLVTLPAIPLQKELIVCTDQSLNRTETSHISHTGTLRAQSLTSCTTYLLLSEQGLHIKGLSICLSVPRTQPKLFWLWAGHANNYTMWCVFACIMFVCMICMPWSPLFMVNVCIWLDLGSWLPANEKNDQFQTSFRLQYEYGQQQLSSQALSLVRVVLNTLDSHFHRCRKVDDPALCGASSAYSRGVSVGDKVIINWFALLPVIFYSDNPWVTKKCSDVVLCVVQPYSLSVLYLLNYSVSVNPHNVCNLII